MKKMILLSTLIFSLTATAEEAGFFGPGQIGNKSGCTQCLKPGRATVANNIGVRNTRNAVSKPKRGTPAPGASQGAAPVSK